MEKTIFVFQRHKDRDKQDFARHYIGNHAPLGTRLVRSLLGYTVNIVDAAGGPDAITEHWLDQASDLLDPERSYESQADYAAVVADDRTLFDSSTLHVVVDVTNFGEAGPLLGNLGKQNPETKCIWLYGEADMVPPPPAAARRVVDNHVGYKLVFEDGARKQVAPDYRVIRMAWGDGMDATGAIAVREFPFVAEPQWRG